MPRLLAPSISSTSTSLPALMLWQMSHWLQGVGVGPELAIEGLGQDARRRRLADAAGAGEQIGVPDAVGGDGVGQGPGDVLLADQLVEGLRPIAPGHDDIFARRRDRRADGSSSADASESGSFGRPVRPCVELRARREAWTCARHAVGSR